MEAGTLCERFHVFQAPHKHLIEKSVQGQEAWGGEPAIRHEWIYLGLIKLDQTKSTSRQYPAVEPSAYKTLEAAHKDISASSAEPLILPSRNRVWIAFVDSRLPSNSNPQYVSHYRGVSDCCMALFSPDLGSGAPLPESLIQAPS